LIKRVAIVWFSQDQQASNQDDKPHFFKPSGIALTIIVMFTLVSLSAANAKSTAAFMPRLVPFQPRHRGSYFVMAN
jgi:hypothetical protein|tara:strand:+ start:43 stop:270 length:228 start_codon:yes stop_codon:yes gene_type:complete